MTFAYPHLLYLLIIPVILIALAWWMGHRRSLQWELLVAPELRKELVIPPSYARRLTALILGLLGLTAMIVALARPQWGEREVQEVTKGRNLLIAMDISRSMLTRDVQPSRMEQARTAAFDLLDALPEDKIGLIVFSGDATLVVPLTHDHNAIRETLEQANYGWAGYGGTNFNQVIETALETFKRTDGTNALVLLSDGENTEPIKHEIAEQALKSKLIVIAAGVGTITGATIPDESNRDGLYHDASGKLVISKFDPTSLQALAKDTNGQYASISNGNSLNNMVRDVAKRLDERESGSSMKKIAEERYAPFLALGMLFLALSLMLSAQWSKKGRHSVSISSFLLFFCVIGMGSASAQDTVPALPEKPDTLREPSLNAPKDAPTPKADAKELSLEEQAKNAFSQGYEEAKKGNQEKAVSSYSQALLSEKSKVQAEAHYNLANSLVEKNLKLLKSEEAQKILSDEKSIKAMEAALKEAITHYDDTLKKEKGHSNAEFNKKVAEQIIKKLEEQQKQNQQKQDQQNKDQQNKDQQNKDQQNKDQQNKDQQNKDQQNKDQQNKDQQNKDQQNKDQQNKDQQNKDQQNKDQQNKDQQNKDQQNKDQQNKDQQNKDQQNKDQQNKDQQNKDQQNKDQQNKDQQNKDQQNKDQQNKDQQNKDQQNKDQQNKDQQNKDQQNKDQQNKDQQNKDQQNKDQNQDQNKDQDQKGTPDQQPRPNEDKGDQKEPAEPRDEKEGQGEPREVPVGEEEGMTKEQAARILKERSNLEKGNPYPTRRQNHTPVKDW